MENSIENIQRKSLTADGENPLATSLYNLINRERLDAIRVISSRLLIDANEISEKRFGLRVDELSNAGADELLEIMSELYNHASAN